MAASVIIKRFDVIKQICFSFVSGVVVSAMHPFTLQTVKETLCGRIILAVTLSAHGANHAVFLELRLKSIACVLAAAV